MKKLIELKYKYNKLNLEHESSIRIEALAKNIGAIIKRLCPSARKGLDIGCQRGQITEIISRDTNITFYGIEPEPNEVLHCLKSVTVIHGHAEDLSFPNSYI
jgi:tRNA G46 methylase TrmB